MGRGSRLAVTVSLVGTLIAPVPSSAQERCTRKETRKALHNFVTAYNRGDVVMLDSMWAEEPDFQWYNVGPSAERLDGGDRSTLIPYFADRHEAGDEIGFARLRVLKGKSWHGGRDFNYTLRRTSDDLWPLADGLYSGKGAITKNCQLFVWSMGWASP